MEDKDVTKDAEASDGGTPKEEAKKSGTESSRSPVQRTRHRNKDARRRLRELEENVVAKSRKDTVRATVPGAVAEVGDGGRNNDTSPSQVEQDALTKRRLRRERSAPSGSGAEAALNRLESDIVSKRRSGRPAATVPGAVPSTSSDSRIADGAVISRTSSSDQRAKLRDLESDTLAKSRARAGRASSTTMDPAARKIAANSGAATGTDSSTAYSSIRTLERDVLAKSRSRSRSSPGTEPQSSLTAVSEEAPGSDRAMDTGSGRDLYDDGLAETDSNEQNQLDSSAMVDGAFGPSAYSSSPVDATNSDRSVVRAHSARVSPVTPHSTSTPSLTPSIGVDSHVGDETNALQAFVADTVVDATGVAVVMSDEDIKRHEEQKSRRYLCFGCIGFVIVTVAIVVPLVLVLGKSDSQVNESAPTAPLTIAPSPSPSLQPTSFGLAASIDFLASNGISDRDALEDRESPQYRAMEWISDGDFLDLDFNDPQEQDQWIQRYLLATFYFATNGDSWTECSQNSAGCATSGTSWLTIDQECDWLAILCNDSNVVTGIAFLRSNGNNLAGTLPEEFFQLTGLQALILQNNQLQGAMSGSWGQLSNLLQVVLTGNRLTGTIPEEFLSKATKLGRLLLDGNGLQGELSSSFSQLPLTQLRLEGNLFDGTIPEELFDVVTLQELRLGVNSLSGTLSERFGELTALSNLQLQSNMFAGPIPVGFDLLDSLQTLLLQDNLLTGSISEAVCTVTSIQVSVDCDEVECTCCKCF